LLSKTEPHVRAAAARILGETDATVRGKVRRLDATDRAFHETATLLPLLVRDAKEEIEATGSVSDEHKEALLSDAELRDAGLRIVWESAEEWVAREKGLSIKNLAEAKPDYAPEVLLAIVRKASFFIVFPHEAEAAADLEVANDLAAIPDAENLNTAFRACAGIERSLDRAADRIDRLQRRRKGEPVPPFVSVRLTR